ESGARIWERDVARSHVLSLLGTRTLLLFSFCELERATHGRKSADTLSDGLHGGCEIARSKSGPARVISLLRLLVLESCHQNRGSAMFIKIQPSGGTLRGARLRTLMWLAFVGC
ncbi:unnamed protein product, partial [Mycena citricolor]